MRAQRAAQFFGHDPLQRPLAAQAVFPGRLLNIVCQGHELQRHVEPRAAGEFLILDQVGDRANGLARTGRVVGGNLRQGQDGGQFGGVVLIAVAHARGEMPFADRHQLVTAAGHVPAEAGNAVDLLAGGGIVGQFRFAAESPAEVQNVGAGVLLRVERLSAQGRQQPPHLIAAFGHLRRRVASPSSAALWPPGPAPSRPPIASAFAARSLRLGRQAGTAGGAKQEGR